MMTTSPDAKPGREHRVLSKVTYDHGCWLFLGAVDVNGYGRIGHKDGTGLAHRAVYIALIGDPGPDVVLDHMCRNTMCVNPWHLRPTNNVDNVLCGANKRDWTHCKKGHEYTPENTARGTGHKGNPKRVCRTCMRGSRAKHKAKIRARRNSP